nr:hypothetical protein [Trichocoleus desertorum]
MRLRSPIGEKLGAIALPSLCPPQQCDRLTSKVPLWPHEDPLKCPC